MPFAGARTLFRTIAIPFTLARTYQGPALIIVHSFTPACSSLTSTLDIRSPFWFARTTLGGNPLTMVSRLPAPISLPYHEMPSCFIRGRFYLWTASAPAAHPDMAKNRAPAAVAIMVFLHIFLSLHGRRTYIETSLIPYFALIVGSKHDSVTSSVGMRDNGLVGMESCCSLVGNQNGCQKEFRWIGIPESG